MAENCNNLIQEGGIYEIKKANIQLAERAFNPTKCDYKLLFNDSCQITAAPDNGKFGDTKFSIVPLSLIGDLPIGKLVDVFGFILEDKGFQEFQTKSERSIRHQKIILADDTLYKIELTLWEPFGKPDNKYSLGELLALRNCRVKEFGGKKCLSSTDSSEIRNSLDKKTDDRLRSFFDSHQNMGEYKDIQGEIVYNGGKAPSEFMFIKDITSPNIMEMEYKDRPTTEIIGTVVVFNHSDRNYYHGCSKCFKKMEEEVCTFCSCNEKKIFLTLNFKIRDATSSTWVEFFGDNAEKFIGIKGDEYERILKKETNNEENQEILEINKRIIYHTFSFLGKIKDRSYNEKKSYRFSAFRFSEKGPTHQKNLVKKLTNLLK